jgi:hypothetical protein
MALVYTQAPPLRPHFLLHGLRNVRKSTCSARKAVLLHADHAGRTSVQRALSLRSRRPTGAHERLGGWGRNWEGGIGDYGKSNTLFYDPVLRVVATLHPNNTYAKEGSLHPIFRMAGLVESRCGTMSPETRLRKHTSPDRVETREISAESKP